MRTKVLNAGPARSCLNDEWIWIPRITERDKADKHVRHINPMTQPKHQDSRLSFIPFLINNISCNFSNFVRGGDQHTINQITTRYTSKRFFLKIHPNTAVCGNVFLVLVLASVSSFSTLHQPGQKILICQGGFWLQERLGSEHLQPFVSQQGV